MYMTQMYKYEIDNVICISSYIPDEAIVLEFLDILTAEEGYDLFRISDGENVGNSIWLHDGDIQENYKEVESIQPDN